MTTKDEMKNLEQVQRFREQEECQYGVAADNDGQYIDRDEALEAARLDIDAARADGYLQGVEDMFQNTITAMMSMMAGGRIEQNMEYLREQVAGLKGRTVEEIRQRLERLNKEARG